MFTEEELKIMTEQAKQKLSNGVDEIEIDENTDLYAEFRDEDDKVETTKEDIVIKNQPTILDAESENGIRGQRANISTYMSDEDMEANPEILSFDEPLFIGGPTKSQLDSWKKQWEGYDIYVTEIQEQYFIFRTLNRFEYKQIVALPNVDALQREEIICETVTLFPYSYKWDVMAKDKAGLPSTFSQIIMEKSGFTNEYSIEVL